MKNNKLIQLLGLKKISNSLKVNRILYQVFLADQNKQKGAVLVIAAGFGILLALLGSIAIMRSGKEQVNASVNEGNQQALAIATAGVEQFMNQINNTGSAPLLLRNQNPFNPENTPNKPAYEFPHGSNETCVDDSDTPNNECNGWQEFDDTNVPFPFFLKPFTLAVLAGADIPYVNACDAPTDPSEARDSLPYFQQYAANQAPPEIGAGRSRGTYELLAYRFRDGNGNDDPTDAPNQGELLVEGNVSQMATSDSRARFMITFPIDVQRPTGRTGTPGDLMAEDIEVGNADILQGVTQPPIVACTEPSECPLNCQRPPSSTLEERKRAIDVDAAAGAVLDPRITIQIGGPKVPDVPSINPATVTVNIINSTDFTGPGNTLELPRTAGTPDVVAPDGRYYYKFNNVGVFDFNNKNIKVLDNNQVRIYIPDNVTFQMLTNQVIAPIDSGTGNLKLPVTGQIILYGADLDTATGQPILPSTPNEWEISSNSCLHGSIHAPNTHLSYQTGAGTIACNTSPAPLNNTNLYGVFWLKSIGKEGNNANALVFRRQDGLLDLLQTPIAAGGGGFTTNDFQPTIFIWDTITRSQRQPIQ